jgi:hypothetical protein
VQQLSANDRLPIQPRFPSSRIKQRLHMIAIYSSLALIAAVVVGSLSVHTF